MGIGIHFNRNCFSDLFTVLCIRIGILITDISVTGTGQCNCTMIVINLNIGANNIDCILYGFPGQLYREILGQRIANLQQLTFPYKVYPVDLGIGLFEIGLDSSNLCFQLFDIILCQDCTSFERQVAIGDTAQTFHSHLDSDSNRIRTISINCSRHNQIVQVRCSVSLCIRSFSNAQYQVFQRCFITGQNIFMDRCQLNTGQRVGHFIEES